MDKVSLRWQTGWQRERWNIIPTVNLVCILTSDCFLILFLYSMTALWWRIYFRFLDSVSGARYEVIDWAKRAMLFVNERAVSENEIFLVLLENCNSKRVELTLTPLSLWVSNGRISIFLHPRMFALLFGCRNELSRWTVALNPQHASESEDSIYESWGMRVMHFGRIVIRIRFMVVYLL